METQNYKYMNLNPKNKHCGDCVIRAIANACEQSWEQTIRELTELGIKKGFVAIDKHTYYKYLELKGFKRMKEPRNIYNKKITIREWMQYNNTQNQILVVNAGTHHLTCIKDNKIEDTWNCSNQTMHVYFVK